MRAVARSVRLLAARATAAAANRSGRAISYVISASIDFSDVVP
jgi:hypothetical protein